MKTSFFFYFFLLILLTGTVRVSGQTPELKNDTLYSGKGLKLFVGQRFVLGDASGEAGQYRSIIPGKAALVPSIWGQDKRYEYAIENYVSSKKDRQKMKETLIPGQLLTITKIRYSKTGKPYFYMASLSGETGNYNCDIQYALQLGELVIRQ